MSDGWEAFLGAQCAPGTPPEPCDPWHEVDALRGCSSDDESSSPSVPRSQQTSDPAYVRLLKEHTLGVEAGGVQSSRPILLVSACTAACAEAAVLEDLRFHTVFALLKGFAV